MILNFDLIYLILRGLVALKRVETNNGGVKLNIRGVNQIKWFLCKMDSD